MLISKDFFGPYFEAVLIFEQSWVSRKKSVLILEYVVTYSNDSKINVRRSWCFGTMGSTYTSKMSINVY